LLECNVFKAAVLGKKLPVAIVQKCQWQFFQAKRAEKQLLTIALWQGRRIRQHVSTQEFHQLGAHQACNLGDGI
jgi:hypothetical protein